MSTRREDFFSDGRKEKQNASRASNKTRENDQSFAVWPMGGSGGVGDATRSERGEKTGGGGGNWANGGHGAELGDSVRIKRIATSTRCQTRATFDRWNG